MNIYLLVEGPSEEDLLVPWLRRFQPNHKHVVLRHEGKGHLPRDPRAPPDPRHRGLLDQLPAKLRAYGKELNPATDRVLVLLDLDRDVCVDLKQRMCGLLALCDPPPQVKFRIAVEETEAFYLGDIPAVRKAFKTVKQAPLRSYVQDSVCGTWEVFQAVIGSTREDKRAWAKEMSSVLGTETSGRDANRSPSFLQFCAALRILAGEPER